MFLKRSCYRLIGAAFASMFAASSWAADLAAIKARGEIRHIGIRYANFVTGAGDGLDVELMQGFAKRIGVSYKLVYSDFYSVIRDLLGKDVLRKNGEVTLTGDYPVKGDVISTGFTMLSWREAILLYSDPILPSQVLLVRPPSLTSNRSRAGPISRRISPKPGRPSAPGACSSWSAPVSIRSITASSMSAST